MPKKLSFKT